jgi:hypothetical protein
LLFFVTWTTSPAGELPVALTDSAWGVGLFFFFIPPPIKHDNVKEFTSWKHFGVKASKFINTSSAAAYQ